MAAGVRTRKRQREEGVLDSVELTRESASAFVDQMRDAVTQGTIEELIGAVQRAGPEGLRALVAKGGLRRFRQWLKELMDGGHVSVSPKRSVSVERAVLVDYVLQVKPGLPLAHAGVGCGRKLGNGARAREELLPLARRTAPPWLRPAAGPTQPSPSS